MWEILLTKEAAGAIAILITAIVGGFISLGKYLDDKNEKRAETQRQQFVVLAQTMNKVDAQVSNTHSTNLREDLDLNKEALERIENRMVSMHSDITQLTTLAERERAARERADKQIHEELDQVREDKDRAHTSIWQKIQNLTTPQGEQ